MPGKSLYLANPYGFNPLLAEGPLLVLQRKLENMGFTVWEPFQHNSQLQIAEPSARFHAIGQRDREGVQRTDGVLAVVDGCPPDEGVMVEIGMAIAWDKPVFFFRGDRRQCTDSSVYPLNLMLFTGLPPGDIWKDYWYTEIEDLSNPNKALAQFV